MPDRSMPHDVVGVVEKARWWGNNSPLLSEQGDGRKAFASLLLTLTDPFSKVVFIDEPETFLHPPQRREMGKAVVNAANRGKQVFVATHDAEFQGRHFIGLNGSSTVLVLFDLMANAKMSVCCIMDIDFLLNAEASSSFVNQVAPLLREKHTRFANDMHARDDYEGVKKSLKKNGLGAFDEKSRIAAEELIEEYGQHGVHIIPQGELESWFSADQPIGKNDIGKMVEAISNDDVELENLHRFMERVFQSK